MAFIIKNKKLIIEEIRYLSLYSRFNELKQYIQHGSTSVYEHCVNVACLSLWIYEKTGIKVNKYSLVKGALLHDYFLYDWHVPDKTHRLHGFTHPGVAFKNASQSFKLNEREKDIIIKHMFPLTPVPPYFKESWIVTIADKICSIMEILHLKRRLM